MAKIHVLDKNISELIAAGEVVERPASVVKELVENAVDAGASKITVEIKSGGIGYIRITDNGHGINSDDIENAFLRHATSKVSSKNDLDAIGTLGFRGEALASIAAVSKVEIITKTPNSLDGCIYKIDGGEATGAPSIKGAPDGTTIIIRDIFYNIPARMKFLRRDVAEGNAAAQVIDKSALAHPNIAFEFIRDGQSRLKTSGTGDLLAVIASVYDRDFARDMIKVDYDFEDKIKVTGYVGKPSFSKPSRTYQNVFVNSRYVRTRTASAALEEAYKGKIMTGKFPVCVLNIAMSLSQVDVNVHPAKIEVRFSEERAIYNAVYFAVKTAINNPKDYSFHSNERKTDKVSPLTLDLPIENPQQQRINPDNTIPIYKKEDDIFRGNLSLATEQSPDLDKDGFRKIDSQIIDRALSGLRTESQVDATPLETANIPTENATHKNLKLVGELFNTYILLESENEEFIVVDKHAAHERIMYEKVKNNSISDNRQVLLSPISVTLSRQEYSAVIENLETIESLGFFVEDFGTGTLIVRETPILLDGEDVQYLLSEIAVNILKSKRDLTPSVLDELYFSIACKGSLRGGDRSHKIELEEIIRKLERDPSLSHCPHGRPVSLVLTKYQIEKMFGRLG